MTAAFDEEGHRTTYVYDALDQLIREIDPRGSTTYYTYSTNCYQGTGLLTAEERQLNATERSRTSYTYESSAPRRVLTETKKISSTVYAVTSYTYGALLADPLTVTQVDAALGDGTAPDLVTANVYDSFGNLTSATNAEGEVTVNAYDLAGRVTVATDAAGIESWSEYSILGDVTASWREISTGEKADITLKTYDRSGRVSAEYSVLVTGTVQTNAVTIEHTYDAAGRERESDNLSVSGSAKTIYDARGNIVVSWAEGVDTGALGTASRSSYNTYGQIRSEIAPGASESSATVTSYYANGLTEQVTNPDGTWTAYTYDDGGLTLTESKPTDEGTATTSYRYDIGGRLIESVSPEGAATTFTYDLLDRQTSAGAEGQPASTTVCNASGWTLSTTDSDGIAKTTRYDMCGRAVYTSDGAANITTTVYDSCGRQTSATDADGNVTAYSHDLFSRVAEEARETSAAVPLKTTAYEYDTLSRVLLKTVVDHSAGTTQTVAFTYPVPAEGVATGGIASVGGISSITPAGIEGASVTVTQPGGVTTTVTYGENGYEDTRESATPAGSVTRDTVTRNTAMLETRWKLFTRDNYRAYDSAGRLTSQDGDGFTPSGADYTYNTSGSKSEEHFSFSFDGGTAENNTYSYSASGRLTSAAVAGVTTGYTYETGSGNLTAITRPGANVTLTYDAANRLTGRTAAGVTTAYAWFTESGRRHTETVSGVSLVTYGYTAAGRLASWARDDLAGSGDTTATFAYDTSGQRTLTHLTEGSRETTLTYSYSGLSLLRVAGESREGTASSSWSIAYLYDESGRPCAGVYTGPESLDASGDPEPIAFGIVTTDRGDVRELTDTSGAAFAFYSYDAYGNPIETTSMAAGSVDATLAAAITEANPIRYAGYAFDSWSGLYYLSQRYYDPSTASFITKDPAKSDGEESAYQYCGGEPVGKVDPSGDVCVVCSAMSARYIRVPNWTKKYFSWSELNGVFHWYGASFQKYLGYVNWYDDADGTIGADLTWDTQFLDYSYGGWPYWRIEIWKGTYGFKHFVGSEIGIYHRSTRERSKWFGCSSDYPMSMDMTLTWWGSTMFSCSATTWWLTGFRWAGCSRATKSGLRLTGHIKFPTASMRKKYTDLSPCASRSSRGDRWAWISF